MGVKGKNPHDSLVVDTFGQVEHASGLLASLLPEAITRHLDLSTLELSQDHLVDEKLRETETDLLYRVETVGGGEAFVYVLLEHQSTADGWRGQGPQQERGSAPTLPLVATPLAVWKS